MHLLRSALELLRIGLFSHLPFSLEPPSSRLQPRVLFPKSLGLGATADCSSSSPGTTFCAGLCSSKCPPSCSHLGVGPLPLIQLLLSPARCCGLLALSWSWGTMIPRVHSILQISANTYSPQFTALGLLWFGCESLPPTPKLGPPCR